MTDAQVLLKQMTVGLGGWGAVSLHTLSVPSGLQLLPPRGSLTLPASQILSTLQGHLLYTPASQPHPPIKGNYSLF